MFFFIISNLNLFAAEPGITADSILVGSTTDKSGPLVYEMNLNTEGMIAYFEKAYAEGIYKRKVVLMTEDGGYNPTKTLAAGKLLLDRDNVFCFVDSAGTAPTMALYELLQSRKVPLLTVSSMARSLALPFKRYVFVQLGTYYDQGRVAVDFILRKDQRAKIGIIFADDSMGQDGRDGCLAQMEKYGINPVGTVSYPRGTTDFSSSVLKLKSLDPDWVINVSISAAGAGIHKEAQKLNWKPNWVGIVGMNNPQSIALAGDAMDFAGEDKVYATQINFPHFGDTPGAIEFREAMKKYRPKADVTYDSMIGYGRAKIVVEALKRAEAKNDLNREGVIGAMETLKDFETGVLSPITYTSTYHGAPPGCLIVKKRANEKQWIPISNEWVMPK